MYYQDKMRAKGASQSQRELTAGYVGRENEKMRKGRLLVYSTLPKFETWAKFEMEKRCVGTVRRIRKETEGFGRKLRENLMKKGCKMGGVSL